MPGLEDLKKLIIAARESVDFLSLRSVPGGPKELCSRLKEALEPFSEEEKNALE